MKKKSIVEMLIPVMLEYNKLKVKELTAIEIAKRKLKEKTNEE